MRIPPASVGFTFLLGFLVALPSFGIDMSLPALTATGAELRVAPAQAGDETLFRVRVGPFADQEAAASALARVTEAGYRGAKIITN